MQVQREINAAAKARWLAELDEALEQARQLIKVLGAADGQFQAIQLYSRIETLRLEVKAMRLGRQAVGADEIEPKRSQSLPWQQGPGRAR